MPPQDVRRASQARRRDRARRVPRREGMARVGGPGGLLFDENTAREDRVTEDGELRLLEDNDARRLEGGGDE